MARKCNLQSLYNSKQSITFCEENNYDNENRMQLGLNQTVKTSQNVEREGEKMDDLENNAVFLNHNNKKPLLPI